MTNGALSGTAADLVAAFAPPITTHTGAVTITDQPSLGNLIAINNATTGAITLQVTNGALTGTAAQFVSAFAGTVTTYTGQLTLTNAPSVAQLKAINDGGTGNIVLQVTNGALSGTAADLVSAFAGTVTTPELSLSPMHQLLLSSKPSMQKQQVRSLFR